MTNKNTARAAAKRSERNLSPQKPKKKSTFFPPSTNQNLAKELQKSLVHSPFYVHPFSSAKFIIWQPSINFFSRWQRKVREIKKGTKQEKRDALINVSRLLIDTEKWSEIVPREKQNPVRALALIAHIFACFSLDLDSKRVDGNTGVCSPAALFWCAPFPFLTQLTSQARFRFYFSRVLYKTVSLWITETPWLLGMLCRRLVFATPDKSRNAAESENALLGDREEKYFEQHFYRRL